MAERVLVTGATGFVGSHLSRRMVKDGWEVHAIIRDTSKCDLILDIKDSIYFHVYDGTSESMYRILAEAKPKIVFHLASLFLSEHKPEDITSLIQCNITFGTHLVDAAVANNCLQLVNTGTSWQHYENAEYSPVNLYAATKQAFEDLLRYYAEAHGLKVITLKLFDTYGSDDPRPKLMNLLKQAAETGKALKMSPGEQLIDMVHVDDVVEAYCSAQKLFAKLDTCFFCSYGVSSGTRFSLKDIVKFTEKKLKSSILVHWGEKPYRKREVMIPWSNYKIIPGWVPNKKFKSDL